MKVYMFYRAFGEHRRRVEEFMHDFKQRTGRDIEQVDPDTSQGSFLAELHDVVEYPTILATRDDGSELGRWRGANFPTIQQVSAYVA